MKRHVVVLAVLLASCDPYDQVPKTPGDTLIIPGDTVILPGDTIWPAPDTVVRPPDTVVLPPDTVIVTCPIPDTLTKAVVWDTLEVASYQVTQVVEPGWEKRFPQIPVAYASAYDAVNKRWVILISKEGYVCPTKDYPPPMNPPTTKPWKVYCSWLPRR